MGIAILPPEVTSHIAAGEVVERPASVVKELIENSLDALATKIVVETKGGGLKFIRVTDNGYGIPPGEIELAFQRYATGKIHTLKDLENISTLGFRGEALPAIAAVSQVEVTSRTPHEPIGIFLSLNEGKVVEKLSRGRPIGTTVIVRNLFQNFPARRKFLKSPATENAHIQDVVQAYALSFPEVQFSLYMEGQPVLYTSGSGDLKQTIAEVFGGEILEGLKPLSFSQEELNIRGFIGLPTLSYSTRSYLNFFVNRRRVSLPKLARLVEEAYKGLIAEDRHPFALLFLGLPPSEIDVNVHPAKAEVRFHRETKVMEAVSKALSQALSMLTRPPIPPEVPQVIGLPTEIPLLRVLGQLFSSYIIAEGPDGLYLVDQHTAHERIIYEEVLSQLKEKPLDSQGLLEPVTIELIPKEEEVLGRLEGLGFCLEPFGPHTYLIREVPTILKDKDFLSALKEILKAEASKGDLKANIAATIACHGAIKAGQVLSMEEMRELVRKIEKLPSKVCPHGRPIVLYLSSAFLAKEFGRG